MHTIAKQLLEWRGNSRFSLTFRWSARHVRIARNKDADKQAKAAVDRESSDKNALPPCLWKKIGYSISAI
jgi:ribonuclease HI